MNFRIIGIHHIEFTVSSLVRTKKYYEKLPGFKLVANYPNFIMFYTGSFYVGFTDHKGSLKEKKFNEKNVGMDHVSFTVSSRKDLEEALLFFDTENIPHGQIKKLSNNTYVLAFRDP
ncbi:VOC family protein, partial [Candidatus Roizmanbacteria bacterium]|nr:VOC family protein [Candidatus Roizmanbacteria bacterium]